MKALFRMNVFCVALLLMAAAAHAQTTVSARVELPPQAKHAHAAQQNAVLWLEPVDTSLEGIRWPFPPPYRLLQKDRMFQPHLLVVPIGASVAFPNADPYFHNVFSLFEGSRFDLGLYEAGSTRNVRFSRKGVSYIFCNIHPEMGAVVLSLDTPLWATLGTGNTLFIRNVPKGTYEAHLWVEGQEAYSLTNWRHTIVVPASGMIDAGTFHGGQVHPSEHLDKFGHTYRKDAPAY